MGLIQTTGPNREWGDWLQFEDVANLLVRKQNCIKEKGSKGKHSSYFQLETYVMHGYGYGSSTRCE